MQKRFWTVLFLLSAFCAPANAQMFDESLGIGGEDTQVPSPSPVSAPAATPALPKTDEPAWARPKTAEAEQPKEKEQPKKKEDVFIPKSDLPQTMRPTLDGVKRGRTSIHEVVDGKAAKNELGLIFMYYKDFSVKRMMSGMVTCDVTFVVLTTLDQKLSNISYKLVWPKMQTSLSYDDVNPNEETIFKYTLLGDGCYSMDSIPNVVVNRCRIKNLTQQECASRIRWIKKR